MKLVHSLQKSIKHEKVPPYFDLRTRTILRRLIRKEPIINGDEIKRNAMFIGSMHFMDPFNFDLERLKKCGVHYATPDGRSIPFCAYNTLPYYRPVVERNFGRQKE